jgi:PQQ-dependent catabolism-associated CXXCW motif protein
MMWKLAALITATLTLTPLACAPGGNNETLLVIYCQADCWMSWNAAKQALSYGYTNVAWYPEGTDGWQRANCRWRIRSQTAGR